MRTPCLREFSRKAQALARIIDAEPPNSVAWRNAARELARLTKESLDLARALNGQNILEFAESAAERVRNSCPVEASAAGL
jgi:hypothetical protein